METKRLIIDSEDRLKAFWRKEAEKIRREIAPLPCRCERMNEIVTELVAEAEQWRMLRVKEQLRSEDKKEQLERVIEEVNAERRWAREKPDGTAVVDESSKGSDGNNNEAIGRNPRLDNGRNERPRAESDGVTTDVLAVGCQRPSVMPAEEGSGRQTIDMQESPGALSEIECQWECKERIKRKRNIVVRGIRSAGNGNEVTRNIRRMIREELEVDPKIIKVHRVGGWTSSYVAIMRRKAQLGEAEIWIEDDYTAREREVEKWLKKEAEKKKRERKVIRRGYINICVNGVWWQWLDREGKLEKMFFREERKST